MGYEPNYTKGEILVVFERECGRPLAKHFGEGVGYKLSDEIYIGKNIHIFETEIGNEKEAIEKFKEHNEFVKKAGFRDIKKELIYRHLDEAGRKLQNLIGDIGILSDASHEKRLEDIANFLKS